MKNIKQKLFFYILCVSFLVLCSFTTYAALTDNIMYSYNYDSGTTDGIHGVGTTTTRGSFTITGAAAKLGNGSIKSTAGLRVDMANNAYMPKDGESRTISVWFNATSGGSPNMGLWAFWNTYATNQVFYTYFDANRKLLISWSTDTACGGNAAFELGTWNLWVVRYDGTKIYGTLNNNPICNLSYSSMNTKLGVVQSIVGLNAAGDDYIGMMDEFTVWNRSLSDAEVTTLWNSGAGVAYPFTIANVLTYDWVTSSPLNNTYTLSTTPNFFGSISLITGNWTIYLYDNRTIVGSQNLNSTGNFNITSSALSTNVEHLLKFNATDTANTSNSILTSVKQIYVVGSPTVCNASTTNNTKTCVFGAGSIALDSITSCS